MGEIERDYLNVLVNLTFHVDREPFVLSLENILASDIKMYKIPFDNLQFLANDSIIAAVSLHNFIDKVLTGGFGVQPQAEKQRFFEEFNQILEAIELCLESQKIKPGATFRGFEVPSAKTKQRDGKQYVSLDQESEMQFREQDKRDAFSLESLQDRSKEIMIKRLVLCQKKVPQLLITLIDFMSSKSFVNENLINRCVRAICLIGTHLD